MTLKLRKLSILIIAAVLLVAMAFAGAASALDEYTDGTVKLWVKEPTDTGIHFHLNESKPLDEVKAIYGMSNAYKISSEADLYDSTLSNNASIFILTQDIYCTMPTAIIGTFTGTLIGNGYTIYNLTINGNTQKIGLVGELGDHGTLNYVNLTCANILSSRGYVGGLVGFASSASNVTGCTVMHSDVNGSSFVGGLVGCAASASMNIQNCSVKNSSISSSSKRVGGLVGYTESVRVVSCEVKNCVVSASSNYVGGLVGNAQSDKSQFVTCKVVNCVVSASSHSVGGLVGYADVCSCNGCSAENCTASGSYNVGGLVGGANSASFSDCKAKDCAVAGNADTVGQLAGTGDATGAKSADNVIVDNTKTAIQINLTRVGGNPSEYHMVDSKLTPAVSNPQTFFKELVNGQTYGYAYKSYDNTSDPRVHITSLGAYGTEGGFGYFSVTDPTIHYGITITKATGSYELTSALTKVYGDDGKGYANLSVADPATGTYTLELNGFNATNAGHTDQPIINASVVNLTIKLVDESNLTGSYTVKSKGLLYSSGNLTITDNGKLLVNNTNNTNTPVNGIYVKKNLTIKDGANVIANSLGSIQGLAIYSENGDISIVGENTVVDVKVIGSMYAVAIMTEDGNILIADGANITSTANGSQIVYGLIGDNLTISGDTTVVNSSATSSNWEAYSIGAMCNLTIKSAKKITAISTISSGNASSFAYNSENHKVTGILDIGGLKEGYTFKNATSSITYNQILNNWHMSSMGEGHWCVSNYTAVTIEKGTVTPEIIVSTNIVNFGTVDLNTTPAGAEGLTQTLNVTNNLEDAVSLSLEDSGEVFEFSPTPSTIDSYNKKMYTVSIDPDYQTTVGDYTAILTITNGTVTQYVNLSLSIVNTTGVSKNTTVIPNLPAMEVKKNDDDGTQNVTVKTTDVEISDNNATIRNATNPTVILVITNVTNSTVDGNQVIKTNKDSRQKVVYANTKADLKKKGDEKADYTVSVEYLAVPSQSPVSLTGEFNESYAAKVKAQDSTANVLSMITTTNANPEAADQEIERATITFEIPKNTVTNSNNLRVYHINATGAYKLTPTVKTYDDLTYIIKVNGSGFSAYVVYEEISTPSYSGSTKQTGYTQILSEGQVAPTTTPTTKPTAAPTLVTPTVKPTTQATTQPTQSSPAPIAGLIAGLGAAALVLARLRK